MLKYYLITGLDHFLLHHYKLSKHLINYEVEKVLIKMPITNKSSADLCLFLNISCMNMIMLLETIFMRELLVAYVTTVRLLNRVCKSVCHEISTL